MIKAKSNINEYIAEFPKEIQLKLRQIRTEIKKAAPNATEAIKYGMPTFVLNGNLVYFAAYKNHIGFYPTSSPIRVFNKEIAKYKWSKGAVQFPLDKPLPLGLIKKMVKFRVAENTKQTNNKRSY